MLSTHGKNIIVLLLIAFGMLMFGNHLVSLTHPDEVFYTQTAKEMIAHNVWTTPYIFDAPHFEKPIFFFWLLAGAIKLFGLTAEVARFWPSFFGILGVVVTYWISWMLFNDKKQAFLSGLVLSTSFIYLALSRAVLTDMTFSILVVISLGFFYYGYINKSDKGKRAAGIVLCFVFSAVAVLTKGILGLLFPFITIALFLFYKRDWDYFKSWGTLAGLALFGLITVPWHVVMYQWYGQWFIDEYWFNVHIRRIFEAEHQKSNTWYFYLATMFGGMMPWSLFLIPTTWWTYKSVKGVKKGEGHRDVFVFLLIWIAVVYVIMQAAQSKLASYIFPVFPAIAILIGNYFHQVLRGENTGLTRAFRVCAYTFAGILAAGVPVGVIVAGMYMEIIGNMGPVYVFAFLVVCCSSAIFLFARARQHLKTVFAVGSMTVCVLITLFVGRTYAEVWVSCKDITDVFNTIDQSDSVVLCSKFYVRGVRYYTDRKTAVIDINGKGFFSPHPNPFLNTDPGVLEFLRSQPVTYAIVKEGNVKDLERIVQDVFQMETLEGIGGKYILRITPTRRR